MTDFNVGDRVAALADTIWDEDLAKFNESEAAYMKLYGHHGHVVKDCGNYGCQQYSIHVRWEGVHDGRKQGPTAWTDGHIWHMDDYEIEHVD